jgi:UPF0755 protein
MEKAIQNDTVEPPDDPAPAAAAAPADTNPTASATKPAAPAKRTRSTTPGRQGAEQSTTPAVVQR